MIWAARAGAMRVPGMLGSGAGAMTGGRDLLVLWTYFSRTVRRQKICALMTSSSSVCSSPMSFQSSGLARTSSGVMVFSMRILRFWGKRSALLRRFVARFVFGSSGVVVSSPLSGGGAGFPMTISSKSSWSWAGSSFSELEPKRRCWSPAMILSLRAFSASRVASFFSSASRRWRSF